MGVINVNAELDVRDTASPLPYFDKDGLVVQFTGFESLPNTFSPDTIDLEIGNAADPTNAFTKAVYATIAYNSADWFAFTGTPTTNFIVPAARTFAYVVTLNKTVAAAKAIGEYTSIVTVNFGAYGTASCTIKLKVLAAPTSYITTVDKEYDYAFKTQEILNQYPDHYSPKQIKDSVVSKVFNASAGLNLEKIDNIELPNFFTQRHLSLATDTPIDTAFIYNLNEIPDRRIRKNLLINGGFHLCSNPYQLPNYWNTQIEFTDLAAAYQLINFSTHVPNLKSTGLGVLQLNSHHEFSFGLVDLYQEVDVSNVLDKEYQVNVWYKRSGSNSIPTSLYTLYAFITFDDPSVAPISSSVVLTDSAEVINKAISINVSNKISKIEIGIEYTNLVSIDPGLADNSVMEIHGITLTTGSNPVAFCTNELDKPLYISQVQNGISVLHGSAGVYEISPEELDKSLIPSSVLCNLRNIAVSTNTYRNRVTLPDVVFSTGAIYPQELRVVTSDVLTELELPESTLGRCVAVRVDNNEIRHSYRLGFEDTSDDTQVIIAPDAVQIQSITEDQVGRLWGVAVISNHTHMPVTKITRFMLFMADKQLPKPPSHDNVANILDYPSYLLASAVFHLPVYGELAYASAVQMEKIDRTTLGILFDNGYTLLVNLKYYYFILKSASKQVVLLDNLKIQYPTANTLFI